MTGLGEAFTPSRQPADREPAPGRLALVQAFANSFWDLDAGGGEAWGDAAAWMSWAAARGLGAGSRDEAVRVREALRALAYANHAGRTAGAALGVLDRVGAAARLRFGPSGPRHDAADAVTLVLAVVAEAMGDGSWPRLKACPGPHCGWVYYDGSRNRSSQWCSMTLCGNRVKGRAFRARQRVAR